MSDASTPTTPPPDGRASGPRPPFPRALKFLLGAMLAIVVAVAGLLLVLQNPAIGTRLAQFGLRGTTPVPRATMVVREVRGDWITWIDLYDVRIARGDTLLLAVDTLRVRHDPRGIFVGYYDLARVELRGVTASFDLIDTTAQVATPDSLSLGDILRGRFYGGSELRVRSLTLERGRIVPGAAAPDSVRGFDDISLALSDGRIGGDRLAFTLDRLALSHAPASGGPVKLVASGALRDGRAEVKSLTLRSATSELAARGTLTTGEERGAGLELLSGTADAAPLALADLRPFLPGVALEGDLAGHATFSGARMDSLDGEITATSPGARVGDWRVGASELAATLTDGRADLTLSTVHENASIAIDGWARPLDAKPTYDLNVVADRLPSRIATLPAWEAFVRRANFAVTGRVHGEGFAPARFDFETRLRGAAGQADAAGTFELRDSVGWSVQRMTFRDVDVARLAGQPGPSAVSGTLTARGRGSSVVADVTLDDSHYADWQLASGQARLELDPDGHYRIEGGRFTHLVLDDSDVSGRFRAEGRDSTGRAWIELDPSTVRGQPVDRGAFTLALARGALAIEGGASSPAGSVQLTGTVRPLDATLSYDVSELRFANLDAGAFPEFGLPRTDLTGTMSIAGRGTTEARGRIRLEGSRIGDVSFEGADGTFDLMGGRTKVDLDVRTAGGTATLTAQGDTSVWNATGTVPFGVLADLAGGSDTLTTEGTLHVTAEGQGVSPATARATGRAVAKGRIGNARVDSLEARLGLAGGVATLDTLLLHSNVAEAHGTGRVALFDTTVVVDSAAGVNVAFDLKDLEPLEPILGIDSLGLSHAQLEGRLYGPARNLVFDVSGAVRSLAVNGNRLVGGDVVAHGTLDRTYRLDEAQGTVQLRVLQAGAVRLQTGQLVARWAGGAPTFEIESTFDARHRVSLAGTATFDSAMTHVTLTKADVQADSAAWALVRPARFAYGTHRLVIDDFEARSGTLGLVRAHGAVDRRGTQNLDVEMHALGLDILAAWIGRPNVGGMIDGTLALRGPAGAPQATGSIDVVMTAQGEPAGALVTQMEWNGRQLEIDGAFAPPTGSSLTYTGHLPLAFSLALPAEGDTLVAVRAFEGDVDLHVRGDRMDLASFAPFFDPRQLATPTGVLDVDLHLTGHSTALTGSGKLILEKAMAELPALGVRFDDANVTAELAGDRVTVREARVRSEKGTLTAEGALTIAGLTRIEPDLRVKAENFEAMETKDMHVVATGDVTVKGTVTAPIVRGTASVENSEFQLTEAMMEAANRTPDVPLSPADIRMMEETFGPITAKAPDPVVVLYDASDLDLEVEIRRNTWIRQRSAPRLALELSGNVTVKKRPHAEAELYGRIEPVPGHGYVEQFARRFDFSGGEILLNGPTKSHTVDIQTQYKTASAGDGDGSDVVVKMDVTGQVDDLKLTLSSEPAMSATEIISYIATGQTRSDLAAGGASGQSSTAATLAAQTALSQVTGRVEDLAQESIGLDVVQIRQDAVQGATLVAGRYVSSRLYVGFRQPVQYQANDNTSTSTSYRTQVEVEYEAYQWLLMNLQGESSELNSFIRARRAY